jgi:nucleoside-triphosphatase
MARAHFITGPPGVGKTSLLFTLLERLPGKKGGFTTREIRREGTRVGFQVTELDGPEGILAHVDRHGPPRVGRYGVDLETFEAIGVQALRRALSEADLIVIDEIGTMELLSRPFTEALFDALECRQPVLGTIMARTHPVSDRIKAHPDVTLYRLTSTNREEVARAIVGDLTPRLAAGTWPRRPEAAP